MQIFIRNNTTLTFDFNPTDTIAYVKETYFQKTGIPSEYVIMSCNGKFLKDTKQLSEYNITDTNTIHITIRMPVKSEY